MKCTLRLCDAISELNLNKRFQETDGPGKHNVSSTVVRVHVADQLVLKCRIDYVHLQ